VREPPGLVRNGRTDNTRRTKYENAIFRTRLHAGYETGRFPTDKEAARLQGERSSMGLVLQRCCYGFIVFAPTSLLAFFC
jgi:hypothetical protein